MKRLCVGLIASVVLVGTTGPATVLAAEIVSEVSIWGEASDMTGSASYANRLGGFGSSISYDAASQTLWAIPDRGPGDGSLSFEARLQKFRLDVDSVTGALSNFELLDTVLLKTADRAQVFNGKLPMLPGENPNVLGLSVDPEGLVVRNVGGTTKVWIGEEYGPSILEFELRTDGGITEAVQTSRQFTFPERYIPLNSEGIPDYVSGDIVQGRQRGRGVESLTMTPDGTTLFAAMQAPLVQEGARNSRNIRIAQFDVATGECTAEFIYQLEAVDDINARIPDELDAEFRANQQGRNITVNELFAFSDTELWVVERDNRGVGTGNPLNDDPTDSHPATKRVYRIDTSSATDVGEIDLPDDGSLPAGVTPVSKDPNPVIDMLQLLTDAGMPVPEKFEGISVVPLTGDQPFAVLLSVDNDFSVVDIDNDDTGEVEFFDVYTDGTLLTLDSPVPGGSHMLPSRIYSVVVPEPSTFLLLALAGLTLVGRARIRQCPVATLA